jgi:hypothetical protein
MRVFPHRLAQEDDDLSGVMSDMFGKYLYTIANIPESQLQNIIEWAMGKDVNLQYMRIKDGSFICRVPESDYDKLEDGDRGKYIKYNKNCGYPVIEDHYLSHNIEYIEGDWKKA